MVVWLLMLCGPAHALLPTYTQYDLTGGNWALPNKHYGPADAVTVCTAFAADGTEWLHAQGHPTWSYSFHHLNLNASNGCFIRRSDGGMTSAGMTLIGPACPANSVAVAGGCDCRNGYQEDPTQTSCLLAPAEPVVSSSNACSVAGFSAGKPILPATGEKFRSELDYADSGSAALSFGRTYRSTWTSDASRTSAGLGKVWAHNHSDVLRATPSSSPNAVTVTSAGGYVRTFFKPAGSSSWTATNGADTLVQAGGGGWIYRRADDNSTFNFDAAGKLQTRVQRNGWAIAYAYNASGQLATISNSFGRSLLLAYNSAGQLATLGTPDGRLIGYAYDSGGRLSVVSRCALRSRCPEQSSANVSNWVGD